MATALRSDRRPRCAGREGEMLYIPSRSFVAVAIPGRVNSTATAVGLLGGRKAVESYLASLPATATPATSSPLFQSPAPAVSTFNHSETSPSGAPLLNNVNMYSAGPHASGAVDDALNCSSSSSHGGVSAQHAAAVSTTSAATAAKPACAAGPALGTTSASACNPAVSQSPSLLSSAANAAPPEEKLFLRLSAVDPLYFKYIASTPASAAGLLLRVRRRRRSGSTIEILGRVVKHHSFQGLADFYYVPPRRARAPLDYRALLTDEQEHAEEGKGEEQEPKRSSSSSRLRVSGSSDHSSFLPVARSDAEGGDPLSPPVRCMGGGTGSSRRSISPLPRCILSSSSLNTSATTLSSQVKKHQTLPFIPPPVFCRFTQPARYNLFDVQLTESEPSPSASVASAIAPTPIHADTTTTTTATITAAAADGATIATVSSSSHTAAARSVTATESDSSAAATTSTTAVIQSPRRKASRSRPSFPQPARVSSDSLAHPLSHSPSAEEPRPSGSRGVLPSAGHRNGLPAPHTSSMATAAAAADPTTAATVDVQQPVLHDHDHQQRQQESGIAAGQKKQRTSSYRPQFADVTPSFSPSSSSFVASSLSLSAPVTDSQRQQQQQRPSFLPSVIKASPAAAAATCSTATSSASTRDAAPQDAGLQSAAALPQTLRTPAASGATAATAALRLPTKAPVAGVSVRVDYEGSPLGGDEKEAAREAATAAAAEATTAAAATAAAVVGEGATPATGREAAAAAAVKDASAATVPRVSGTQERSEEEEGGGAAEKVAERDVATLLFRQQEEMEEEDEALSSLRVESPEQQRQPQTVGRREGEDAATGAAETELWGMSSRKAGEGFNAVCRYGDPRVPLQPPPAAARAAVDESLLLLLQQLLQQQPIWLRSSLDLRLPANFSAWRRKPAYAKTCFFYAGAAHVAASASLSSLSVGRGSIPEQHQHLLHQSLEHKLQEQEQHHHHQQQQHQHQHQQQMLADESAREEADSSSVTQQFMLQSPSLSQQQQQQPLVLQQRFLLPPSRPSVLYQLKEIEDEAVQKLLQDAPILPAACKETGWFTAATMKTLRELLAIKSERMRSARSE